MDIDGGGKFLLPVSVFHFARAKSGVYRYLAGSLCGRGPSQRSWSDHQISWIFYRQNLS